jgi:acetyltransferase-like isoleucine patch superfamily enzyme
MKNRIKQIIQQSPVLEKYALILMGKGRLKNAFPKKTILGSGNSIEVHPSVTFNQCVFDIIGNDNKIELEQSGVYNNVVFYIRGDHHNIRIGKNVRFNQGGSIWMEDHHGLAVISDGSTFEEVHLAITEPHSRIRIGADCMFAYDIEVRTGDSHSIVDSLTGERINPAGNVEIGNHVWIASHVSILKGVHISKDSIVATRSVVTRSFEDGNILIGGTPAKKLKENINWNRKRI